MLELLSSPASDGSTYGIKYQLDSEGDNLVFQLLQAEQTRGGDRQFDEQVTITGTVSGANMAVSGACITPTVNNPSGTTFCVNGTSTPTAVPPSASGSTSTTTPASP